jgi:hypothetical protein
MFGRAAESAALAAAPARAHRRRAGDREDAARGRGGAGSARRRCNRAARHPISPSAEALRHYVAHAPEDILAAHVREHKGEM